jgi:hypothetical protein
LEVEIIPLDNANALRIRYRDPAQLAELKGWVAKLDRPKSRANHPQDPKP